jgi:pimeloyl-ACP methyl ester carboxylesterase
VLLWRARRRAPRLGETLVVDGVSLHYLESGSGPPVVFLHGAKGSVYDAMLSVGPELARRYRFVAFDRPGSGYSGRAPRHNGSPAVQADLIDSALRGLGVERPVIVAHSTGAAVALALALARPERVAAVVTLGGYVFSARRSGGHPGRILAVPVLGPLLRATVVVPLGLALAPPVLRHVFAPGPVDAAYARVATSLAVRPGHLAADSAEVADVELGLRDLAPRYGELRVPLVAVHGLADEVVSSGQSVRLCQLAPDGELVLLDDAGHQPHFTRPDAVLEAVDEAWRRAAAEARGDERPTRRDRFDSPRPRG